ncbi:MAG: ChrR family anti-sigma-E factor [Hyphomicrobiaceae bacterium]
MAITHHPDPATLLSFAGGGLKEALSAVVAAHVAICPQCAREMRTMMRIGGAALEHLRGEPVEPIDGPRLWSALPGAAARGRETVNPAADHDVVGDVPGPIRPLVGARLDEIAWRRLGYGIWHYPLPVRGESGGDLRLLRISAGLAMPEHGHGGSELTLVLRGAYSDETGTYRAGDLADLDEDVEHRPITDVENGCICLIASEKRARFKTLFGRLVQPLVGL